MNENKELKASPTPADISFEIGFKKEKTRFDLRMISVAEEQIINQHFTDIEESDEKEKKEYFVCLEALASVSVSPTCGAKLKSQFGAYCPKNERVIRAAWQHYRYALNPDVSFL